MIDLTRRAALAALAAFPVAGCAGAILGEGPPAPPEFAPLSYSARADGSFIVPAVAYDQLPAWLHRQVVTYETDQAPGSIVIHSDQKLLHLVLPNKFALRYGISVGRDGLAWTGLAEVFARARWPRWTPTPAMIARDPSLEQYAGGQPGGPTNPLGARAIYLRTVATRADEGIRIHGTPQWRTIGRRASSGCFRMVNHDVIDLFDRVQIGARVLVI